MLGDYGMIYLNKHKSSRRREEAMDKKSMLYGKICLRYDKVTTECKITLRGHMTFSCSKWRPPPRRYKQSTIYF